MHFSQIRTSLNKQLIHRKTYSVVKIGLHTARTQSEDVHSEVNFVQYMKSRNGQRTYVLHF